MLKINDRVGVVFSGLSDLVIQDVTGEDDRIRVIAGNEAEKRIRGWLGIASFIFAAAIWGWQGVLVVVALFTVSWFARPDDLPHDPNSVALTLSIVAGALAGMTAWLGGELVDRLGVGIDDDANLDAAASFKTGIDLRKHEQHPTPR